MQIINTKPRRGKLEEKEQTEEEGLNVVENNKRQFQKKKKKF